MNFKRIYLTGLMGSGKSTVGRILADLVHCSFNDLDEFVKQKAGRSIPKIIKQGDPGFWKEAASTLFGRIREESGD